MSANRNTDMLRSYIDRADTILSDIEDRQEDLKELKKELKEHEEAWGFNGAEVVRLAKLRRKESQTRAKLAQIEGDLDTLSFFKDIPVHTKRGRKEAETKQ